MGSLNSKHAKVFTPDSLYS